MKLLFDQNISHRLISLIQDILPEARQVRQIGIENSSDKQIWEYAKEHDFTIVIPTYAKWAGCPMIRKTIQTYGYTS